MVKSQVKRTINAVLRPMGLRIDTIEELRHLCAADHKRSELITEFHNCFKEFVFPDLPPCAGRLDLLSRLIGTQFTQAIYLLHYLHKSLPAVGDVCEFGVAQGATSALLANEIRDTRKTLWLFDSFQGLPKPDKNDVLIDDIFNLVYGQI